MNARNRRLSTPALWAAQRGHLEVLQALMTKGADLSVRNEKGWDIILVAANMGDTSTVTFLANSGYGVYSKDTWGNTSTAKMMSSKSKSLVTFILNYRCELPASCMIDAVVHARRSGSLSGLRRTMRRIPSVDLGEALNYRGNTGNTPLSWATKQGYCEAMTFLLDAGADIELEGSQFGSPLMTACSLGRLEAVKLLIRQGAKTSYVRGDEKMNVIDASRHHPLVTRWLLVGRLMDHPKLIPFEEIAWLSRDPVIECWMKRWKTICGKPPWHFPAPGR